MNAARVLQVLKPSWWLVEAVVLGVLLVVGLSAASGWRNADRANEFPEALGTVPTARPGTGFAALTASTLMRERPSQHILNVPVDYVPATTRSTGPFVVSVHPIDSSTWAATALGSDGRCYGVLVSQTTDDYETYFARFPTGTPCRGEHANSATVRSTEYPT
jgi:hypothetical protein